MTFSPKAIFQRADKYDGVRPIVGDLAIVAVPWGYAFVNYIYNPKK